MNGPRDPNEKEMELLIQKTMELFPYSNKPYNEADHRENALSVLEKSFVAVFGKWFFWEELDDIDFDAMNKVLSVFWPMRPDFFMVFVITRDDELILVDQSDAMRELETKSSTDE